MRRRTTRSALVALALTAATVTATATPAAAHHDQCDDTHAFTGTTTGTLDATNTVDRWSNWATSRRTVQLNTTTGNVSLTVASVDCGTTYCSVTTTAPTKSCTITQLGSVSVTVTLSSGNGASYTLTSVAQPECGDTLDNDGDGRVDYPNDPGCTGSGDTTESPDPQCGDGVDNDGDGRTDYPNDPGCTSVGDPAESPNPQCSDGADNDGDGKTDYPTDPGCTGERDTQEGPACEPTAGVLVCVTPNSEVLRLAVPDPASLDGDAHPVAGYVEVFRFTLPGGTTVSIPCVRLVLDGAAVNPCADAGGVFVSRTTTLVETGVTEPDLADTLLEVVVCTAELTALVGDIGVNSAEIYTVC